MELIKLIMKKVIKRHGGSLVILFDAEDVHICGLKEGDIVDFTITKVKRGEK